MIRFPPSGAGIPLMEILMALAVPFVFRAAVLREFTHSPIFAPLMLWVLWAGTRVLSSLPTYGMKAIRDGLPVLETIFLVFGFAMASQSDVIKSYLKYLPVLVASVIGYSLLAPISSQLIPFSPTLPSTQGIPVPIFFTFVNTSSLLIACAAYFWVRGIVVGRSSVWAPAICIGIALTLFPSRSLVIQIFMMMGILSLSTGSDRFAAMFSIGGVGLLVVGAILLFSYAGITIAGRLGALSPEDYIRLIREIMIWENFQPGTTLSSGASQRFEWWSDIISNGTANLTNFVFGVGYGEPLMDGVFHGGKVTREPHNSWVSVFGRSGIFGLMAFTYLCVAIVRVSLSQFRLRARSVLLAPMVAFCTVMVVGTLILGLGESPFVMPFTTIPYYFCAGILARMDLARSSRHSPVTTDDTLLSDP